MRRSHAWRWAPLVLIAVLAALVASFNSGERVALSLGFTVLYQLPLVPVIFAAFLTGMVTMFLVGLRHDLRVRRALREAGFGEEAGNVPAAKAWAESDARHRGRDEAPGLEVPASRRSEPPPSAALENEAPSLHDLEGARTQGLQDEADQLRDEEPALGRAVRREARWIREPSSPPAAADEAPGAREAEPTPPPTPDDEPPGTSTGAEPPPRYPP